MKAEAEAKRKAEEEKLRLAAVKKEEEAKKAKAAAAAAAAATAAFLSRKVSDNDYMHCNEYKGHAVNDKLNRVAMFKRNGKFYFAVYDTGGNVKLRSEAFESVKDRDTILEAVLRLLNNKDAYHKIEKGDKYWSILKDKSGRELGRTCVEEVKKAAAVVAPAAAAAATVAAAPVVTKEVVKEKKKGGFAWWWLLIPLLLLGAWFLIKGCDGCNSKPTPPPIKEEVKHEEPKVEEPATVQKSEEELAAEKEEQEKAEAEQQRRIIEEKAIREREAKEARERERRTPAIGVEAGFERVNEHK